MGTDVLLINASYLVLTRVPWQRAVTLVVTGEAEVFEAHPTRMIRSQHLEIPMPTIIRMRQYVHVPFKGVHGTAVSRGRILLRDRRTCGYCGGHADTIDHIHPRSRGGQDSFENLIAACGPCNQRKGDRTPIEAGMKLLWVPRAPDGSDADQERVWLTLAGAAA